MRPRKRSLAGKILCSCSGYALSRTAVTDVSRFESHARTSNSRFRNFVPGPALFDSRSPRSATRIPLSDSRVRSTEARTPPKKTRPIGPPRPTFRRRTYEVVGLRLTLRRQRAEVVCPRSKLSTSDSGMRLFEVRMPPAAVRTRTRKARVQAPEVRDRRFVARFPTFNADTRMAPDHKRGPSGFCQKWCPALLWG